VGESCLCLCLCFLSLLESDGLGFRAISPLSSVEGLEGLEGRSRLAQCVGSTVRKKPPLQSSSR
jgi:hypothetical protein